MAAHTPTVPVELARICQPLVTAHADLKAARGVGTASEGVARQQLVQVERDTVLNVMGYLDEQGALDTSSLTRLCRSIESAAVGAGFGRQSELAELVQEHIATHLGIYGVTPAAVSARVRRKVVDTIAMQLEDFHVDRLSLGQIA